MFEHTHTQRILAFLVIIYKWLPADFEKNNSMCSVINVLTGLY